MNGQIERSFPRKALWLAVLLAGGCGRAPEFRVDLVMPDAGGPLRLNQAITLRFSDDVDPSSVDASSMRLFAAGREIVGRREVLGRQIRFRPAPTSAATLDDGGFRPGEAVTVKLAGFPARSGVRSVHGEPLVSAWQRTYPTVAVTDATPAQCFVDVNPQSGPQVENQATGPTRDPPLMRRDEWFCLQFSEPLWPPCVDAMAVRLLYNDPDRTVVPCELRLQQDFDRAEVWIRPAGGYQAGTRYLIDVVAGRVLDLVGTPLATTWNSSVLGDPAVAGDGGAPRPEGH